MKLRPALVLLLRLALGGLLVVAGALKLRAPAAFATEIANYQLFPGAAPYLAAALPLVEVLLGAGLIAFPLAWRRASALGALGLFAMFSVAVGSATVHHINIDCGCFGTGGGPITALTLLRDLLLIGAAILLLRLDRPGRA
jgi:uncharacterized membrane protein YphA (DoxX/SURF4 family)